jgi:hypothetical protein
MSSDDTSRSAKRTEIQPALACVSALSYFGRTVGHCRFADAFSKAQDHANLVRNTANLIPTR